MNGPVWVDDSDVPAVGYVDGPVDGDRHALGEVEPSFGGGAAVTTGVGVTGETPENIKNDTVNAE